MRKPPSILSSESQRQMYAVCMWQTMGVGEGILCTLLLLWCSVVIERGWGGLVPGCAGAATSRCGFFDWQKQMSIMFISESLKGCQCHPAVSSNLCNGSGRNCQACLSSISHTSWKSRLGCHSYLIHTRPEGLGEFGPGHLWSWTANY